MGRKGCLLVFLCGVLLGAAQARDVAVIVHANNPMVRLEEDAAARYLLLQATEWPNGARVKAVDRPPESPERQVMLDRVFHMDAPALKAYWGKLPKGTPPPPRLKSTADTVNYVASNPGAIAYVELDALTPDMLRKVKAVLVLRRP